MSKTCFFTIVSNNYRHFARTLVASVRAHTPDVDAYVAICDGPLADPDPRDAAYTEISIRDLGLPQFDRFTFQYTILELNTAIKPWVIAALFARGYERVVYFDPDIKLYGSIEPVLARLAGADIVLTPHLTGWLDDGGHPSELAILQSGSYNLGFIALRQSDVTRRFVAWWQRKLERDCVVDIPRGLFTDQKWIDLVPGMYAGVAIERDAGWNVAYWNLNHRAVTRADDGATRVDGRPLLFFHFSGFSPGAKAFSKHQNRFTMENLPPAVRALADDYAADLVRNGFEQCRALPYAFGRFPGGEPIVDLVRRCYREKFPWDEPHPDLWTADGERFVVDWLNRPAPEFARSQWVTRLSGTLYAMRPDVQAAFPDVGGKHGRGYAHWFVEQAKAQERLPDVFVAPLRAALEGRRAPRAEGEPPMPVAPDTPEGVPVAAVHDAHAADDGPLRGVYRIAYRVAWGIRGAVKPLTTQAFRHRVRHALMRKAYFDDSYATPPLVTPAGTVHGGAPEPAIRYPAHVAAKDAGETAIGVNVIGYLAAESGIGESARSMLRILKAAGVPVAPINFRVGNISRMQESIPGVETTEHLHAINLFHVNADQMPVALRAPGRVAVRGPLQHRVLGVGTLRVSRCVGAVVRPGRRSVGAIRVLPAGDLAQGPGARAARAAFGRGAAGRGRSREARPRARRRRVLRDVRRAFGARAQESAGRRAGVPRGVSRAGAGAPFPQDRQPRIPARPQGAPCRPREGGPAHHAAHRLSLAAGPVDADGEHRLLRVAAPRRGVRPRDGGSDGVRQGRDRDAVVGQRRLHARGECAPRRLCAGRTRPRPGSVPPRPAVGGA